MREVEWEVEEGVGHAGEAFAGDFLAGVGGGGEDDNFVGVFGAELSEERFDGEDFADRNGVNPDYAGVRASERGGQFGGKFAGAFAKAVPILVLTPAANGVVRAQDDHADGEENVVEEVHELCALQLASRTRIHGDSRRSRGKAAIIVANGRGQSRSGSQRGFRGMHHKVS